ncbi:hypothetical protein [Paenisporosarcina sp. TG20]|uniref:hypothetical protein n=1 Tax=Paenisporosarcina sp. TG20 TaxID=1211706 RepID=UPI0002F47953|nr:hypothetical protein [Paenisporosarcina sp. TG20]
MSYKGELGGEKETPKLNASHIVESSLGSKTVGDIYKFVNEKYTLLFTINIFTILDYLEQYSTLPNRNPESASGEGKQQFELMKKISGMPSTN